MPDEDEDATTPATEEGGQQEEQENEGGGGGAQDSGEPEDQPLGAKGEKALAAEKARRKEEARRRREAEEELAKLRKGDAGEDAAETARREAEQAATAKANRRILRSEVKAAAAGKLADPADALLYLDLDSIEVDEDGQVDGEEIASAIEDLVKKKPYLGTQPQRRFQGSGDGGASGRNSGKPKQLTREDLKTMTPQQIVKAKSEGRLSEVLGSN